MPQHKYQLFISYEREDAGDSSLLIYTHLVRWFGENAVFRDKQKIPTGAKWQNHLKRHVEDCLGFIVVIGPDWNTSRIQKKLNNPDNWVRKEIECALRNNKPVFPVLMDGVRSLNTDLLPEAIRKALPTNNYFFFSDGPEFEIALNRLCVDVSHRTGLNSIDLANKDKTPAYEQLISRIDRYRETICVKQSVKHGQFLYMAVGGKRAGFRHFAVRCALDALNSTGHSDSGADSQNYKELSLEWNSFAEIKDPAIRKSELLCDISKKLLNEELTGTVDHLVQNIRQKITTSRQPTVVYSTVRSGTGGSVVIDEWFSIWRTLVPQSHNKSSFIVILFVRQGFIGKIMPPMKKPEMCDCLIDPVLGLIERDHIDEWTESQLRVKASPTLYMDVKARWKKLFRFPWSKCRFDDVSDTVAEAWLENNQ